MYLQACKFSNQKKLRHFEFEATFFAILYSESLHMETMFLSADSFSSALQVRLEEDGGGGGDDDFIQKFGKERKKFANRLVQHTGSLWLYLFQSYRNIGFAKI